MKFLNLLISVLLFSAICMSCEDENPEGNNGFDNTWNYLGLDQHNIQEIKAGDDVVFAATRDGMFKKAINSSDTLWQSAGLEGMEITDFVIFNSAELLASVKVSGSQSASLYKTTNGGANWAPMDTNFGGEQGIQTCQALEKDPMQENILFGRGISNVAKSTDGGMSWESTYQDWSNTGYQADLILVDENNSDIVWAGGETSIFSPYLIKSIDEGETWLPQDIPNQGDNAVYSLVIHPDNSDRVLAGMEAQIISTTDGGENWEVNFSPSESSYVNDLQHSLMDTEKVYAIGTDGGNDVGDIILFVSDDFGENWETEKQAGKAGVQYAAQDMTLFRFGDTELIYIGTNRGVFVYQAN